MALWYAGQQGGEPTVSSEEAGPRPTVLFTAFEPGADALAAPVVRALVEGDSDLRVCAFGGPQMEDAGAHIVERTEGGAENATTRRLVRLLREWVKVNRVVVHVPVESAAVNLAIARTMRKAGARIVHLGAPPLWALRRPKPGRLRKLTSRVLCLLPFEEPWFVERRIPATFIGHPSLNRSIDLPDLEQRMHGLPQGAARLGLFPGLRPDHARANTRLLADVYAELRGRHGGACGVVVAATPEIADIVRSRIKVFPTGLHMKTGSADPVIAWCDLALATSDAITLDLTYQRKPMIAVFRTGPLAWLSMKLAGDASHRPMPNIIADREVVPEFVPHLVGSTPIVDQASRILLDSKKAAVQAEELHRVCLRFANHNPAKEAAEAIRQEVQMADR